MLGVSCKNVEKTLFQQSLRMKILTYLNWQWLLIFKIHFYYLIVFSVFHLFLCFFPLHAAPSPNSCLLWGWIFFFLIQHFHSICLTSTHSISILSVITLEILPCIFYWIKSGINKYLYLPLEKSRTLKCFNFFTSLLIYVLSLSRILS